MKSEVQFPLTRLYFVATRFNERYLIEVESDRTTMYLEGLRQLMSIPQNNKYDLSEYKILVVPKIKICNDKKTKPNSYF